MQKLIDCTIDRNKTNHSFGFSPMMTNRCIGAGWSEQGLTATGKKAVVAP
jgi:hypothetical protein